MRKITKFLPVLVLSALMLAACDNNDGPFVRKMENGHQVMYSGEKPAKGMITNSIHNLNGTVTKVSEIYVDKGLPAGDFKLYDTMGRPAAEGKGKWKNGMFEGEIIIYDTADLGDIVTKGSYKLNSDTILDYDGDYEDAFHLVDALYTGTLKSDYIEFKLKEGRKDGDLILYSKLPDGGKDTRFISGKEKYKNGKKEGEFVYYSSPDIMSSKWEYRNGKLNGKAYNYYDDGTLYTEDDYVDDKLDGVHKEYYPDQKVQYYVQFKNGKPDGIYKEFYSNGKLNVSSSFTNGQQDGLRETFAEDGRKISEETYVNGEADGRFCEYDENGNKKVEGTKKRGRYNGVITFYENGVKRREGPYENGYENGIIYKYNQNGIPTFAAQYYDGQQSSSTSIWFDKEGHKTSAHIDGMAYTYYPNGNKKTEGEVILTGPRRGHYIEYYENGNKKYEADFSYGNPRNEIYYNEDGTVKSKK